EIPKELLHIVQTKNLKRPATTKKEIENYLNTMDFERRNFSW
ncbi:MAG: hypothetical protein UW65_C0031G0001, partial [candidate division WWE3 bacterium GW2011_GWB1_44_4]